MYYALHFTPIMYYYYVMQSFTGHSSVNINFSEFTLLFYQCFSFRAFVWLLIKIEDNYPSSFTAQLKIFFLSLLNGCLIKAVGDYWNHSQACRCCPSSPARVSDTVHGGLHCVSRLVTDLGSSTPDSFPATTISRGQRQN